MDRTKLGLVFAKEKPAKRVQTLSASNGTFKIPPQDPGAQNPCKAQRVLQVLIIFDGRAVASKSSGGQS